ncbi:MAG: putative GTPase, partial [Myxococcota bacterium]
CLNKLDLADPEWMDMCRAELATLGVSDVVDLSALNGDGRNELLARIVRILENRPVDDF